jgi:hypothetical protein
MRDTIKTLAGLVIIAVIVVATFLYGNAQRQSQLKHDQQVKKQQQATANPHVVAKANTSATATPGSPSSVTQGGPNTAPVETPQANSVQGGSVATPTPSPAVKSPAPQNTPDAAPATPLPQTGSSIGGFVGVGAVIGAIVAVRRSRQTLFEAARSKR